MKTCMFTTSWLDGTDKLGNSRLDRTKRYLDYYRPLKDELGFSEFFLADNHSSIENIVDLNLSHKLRVFSQYEQRISGEDCIVKCFTETLTRGEHLDYPYVWRGVYFVQELIKLGYEKIIYCETDAFILSRPLAHYIRGLDSGFVSFYSPRYNFPLAEITVLCKDAFPRFIDWCSQMTWQERNKQRLLYETALPFTGIQRGFIGDRYGEFEGNIQQTPYLDFYTQAKLTTPLTYNIEGRN